MAQFLLSRVLGGPMQGERWLTADGSDLILFGANPRSSAREYRAAESGASRIDVVPEPRRAVAARSVSLHRAGERWAAARLEAQHDGLSFCSSLRYFSTSRVAAQL